MFSCTMDADRFAFGGLKLPEGDAPDQVSQFEERMLNCVIFKSAVEAYFKRFAETLANEPDALEKSIGEWIAERDSL